MQCCRIVNGIKNKNIKNSLGATWNASHLAVRLCALRHWKRVSMPPTTQSLRHPLTRAIHFAPRIKTARRFTAKNPWWKSELLVESNGNLSKRHSVGTCLWRKHWKSRQGGDIGVFFADYIWALSTFNNRWEVLFRCRWGAGVWWWGVGASGWFCGGFSI